jgi:hypothetical protein
MLDNPKRIYALQSWTVEKKAKGWFIRRTDHDESWRGPYFKRNERVPHDRAPTQTRTHQARRTSFLGS